MTRRVGRRTVWTMCGWLAIAAAGVAAQSVLSQLGVSEAEARQYLLDNMWSGTMGEGTLGHYAKVSYAKLATAGRGPATTAFYAWAKSQVSAPAFKAAYAKMRTEQKPELQPTTGTPEQEAQAQIAAKIKESDEMVKAALPSIPAADRAKFQAQMKEQQDMLKSKQFMDAIRDEIATKRAKDKKDYDEAMAQWNTNLPADPNVRIGAILREFLANTADVDFAAKTKKVIGEGGEAIMFVTDTYNKKPWQWRLAFDFGPEPLAAARAAASAWVRELPAK